MKRALFLLLICASPLRAQRVSGTVRDSATSAPLASAVVVVTGANDKTLARTVTDAVGHYTLALDAAPSHLRVVRLGWRPLTLTLPATPDLARPVDVAMVRLTTLLNSLSVIEQPSCPASSDGRAAMSLYEQARAALLASVTAREVMPAQATTLSYERTLNPLNDRVVAQTTRVRVGSTTRPFVTARSAADLARTGYLRDTPGGPRYDAPDADVLLDESFSASHCFSTQRDDRAHAGLLGLAFQPAPGRDTLVEVRGVLWVEPQIPELRQLEFRFTHLERAALDALAGGVLHFQTMSNGVVVIDRWKILLPALERVVRPGRVVRTPSGMSAMSRDSSFMRVTAMGETGGVLLHAQWPDATRFDARLGTVAGRATERDGTTTLAGVIVSLVGTADSAVTNADGRFDLTTLPGGRYSLTASDTGFSDVVAPRTSTRFLDVREGDTARVQLDLPARGTVLSSLCAGNTRTDEDNRRSAGRLSTIVGRVVLPASLSAEGLTLTAGWQTDYLADNTAGVLAVMSAGSEMRLDARGRYAFCDVTREHPVHLRLSRGAVRLADTSFVIDRDQPVARFQWAPRLAPDELR